MPPVSSRYRSGAGQRITAANATTIHEVAHDDDPSDISLMGSRGAVSADEGERHGGRQRGEDDGHRERDDGALRRTSRP